MESQHHHNRGLIIAGTLLLLVVVVAIMLYVMRMNQSANKMSAQQEKQLTEARMFFESHANDTPQPMNDAEKKQMEDFFKKNKDNPGNVNEVPFAEPQ